MSGSSFDLIAQELQKQYQVMEQLKAENRALQQQLAELRRGRGIFIEINGTRIALNESALVQESRQTSASTAHAQTTVPSSEFAPQTISEAPTVEIAEIRPEALEAGDMGGTLERQESAASVKSASPAATPSFLEEAMIDEFSAAMTSPLTVRQDPAKKPEQSTKEQKAVLRRELMGSYILE